MLDIGRFYWDRKQTVGLVAGALDKGCRAEHVHPREENRNMTTALLHLSPSRRSVSSRDRETDQGKPSGFTLVELLVAMCVSLLLLGGVVSLFGSLGESVNNSKSNSEMLQTMRHTARQLQSDLGNVSLVPDPAQTQTNRKKFNFLIRSFWMTGAVVSPLFRMDRIIYLSRGQVPGQKENPIAIRFMKRIPNILKTKGYSKPPDWRMGHIK